MLSVDYTIRKNYKRFIKTCLQLNPYQEDMFVVRNKFALVEFKYYTVLSITLKVFLILLLNSVYCNYTFKYRIRIYWYNQM